MTAEHAAKAPAGGWRDDLRHGIRFVLARRRKLVAYSVTAATFLVANGLVSGRAQLICNVVILAAGGKVIDRVRNAPARPRPNSV